VLHGFVLVALDRLALLSKKFSISSQALTRSPHYRDFRNSTSSVFSDEFRFSVKWVL